MEQQQIVKNEEMKSENQRRANIERYLSDLKEQIRINQIQRREEFNRFNTENE